MFQIPNVKTVYMYPRPVPMNWGEKKLTQVCNDDMGLDPKTGAVFLFYNSKKDQMKLFFLDDGGSQEFQKFLPKGSFMLPAAHDGEKYVKIDSKILGALFKT